MKYSHAMARRKRQPSQAPLQHPLAPETSAQASQASVPTRAGSGSWSFAQMPVQRQAPTTDISASSGAERASRQGNQTGLPNQLKVGIEHLSGQSLDNVRVHYNSPKPAQLNALAYTQGTEIYMGPRQERHLGHEAWHVVQQKQGRVRSTMQMKGVAINDDQRLEREADVMGKKAYNIASTHVPHMQPSAAKTGALISTGAIQRLIGFEYQLPGGIITPNTGLDKGDNLGREKNGVRPTIDIGAAKVYELEFISDTFDETTKEGWRDLERAVKETSAMIKHVLNTNNGKPIPVSDAFVGGISNYELDLTSSRGSVQITAGIQLNRLQKFMDKSINKKDKIKTATAPKVITINNVNRAVNRAGQRLKQEEKALGMRFSKISKKEFLSLVTLLGTTMSNLIPNAPYFKSLYTLLNRTDMAYLVQHVRAQMQREITKQGKDIPADFLGFILQVFEPDLPLDEILIPKGRPFDASQENWDNSGLGTLTRSVWLQGLLAGNDQLSAVWQRSQNNTVAADILESVGDFGDRTDPSNISIRPIFEIRNLERVSSLEEFEKTISKVSKSIKKLHKGNLLDAVREAFT